MSKGDNSIASPQKVNRQLFSMVIGYAVIIVIVILTVTNLAIKKTDNVLQDKVVSMSSSLDVQMKLNMNSYLARMESLGTIAFSEEKTYTYDATDPNNDEYEALNTEKAITEKLYSLYNMSDQDYRVSLLIKIRIQPKDIATLTTHSKESVASTRSRLYQKVFGKKGSTKDWDDFILSI